MKLQKLLALFLVLVMLTALFSGCTSKTETEEETATTETAEEETESAAEEETAEEPEEEEATQETVLEETLEEAAAESVTGAVLDKDSATVEEIVLNISDELPENLPLAENEEITVTTSFGTDLYNDIPEGYDGCLITQVVEELTGVHVVWSETSTESWTERFNLMVASGDYPDICNARTDYSGGDDAGIEDEFILPLEDYLEEYMPNYYEVLYDDGYASQILTDEGHISGCAQFEVESAPSNNGNFWIRTDYLEACGYSSEQENLPTTYDEWYEVLTDFKNELGLNEPIMWPGNVVGENEGLASGYGIAGNAAIDAMGTYMPYYVVDDEICFGLLQTEYRTFLEMTAQWYEEGLIGQDFYTKNLSMKDSAFIATITDGDAGIFTMDTVDIESTIDNAVDADSNFACAALRDPMLTEDQTNHFGSAESSATMQCWVTTGAAEDSDHLALVLNWLDFWYTETGSNLGTWGAEGITFIYDEDGSRELTDWGTELFVDGYNRNLNTFYAMSQFGYLNREYMDTNTDFIKSVIEYRSVNVDNLYTLPDGVSLNSEEAYEHSAIYSDIATYINESILKFIVGDKSFDAYDAFVQTLYEMGIEDCIAIYQAAYDRYLTKQNVTG